MTPLERYYKYYNLSRVPADLLRKKEHYNLYQHPPKEKQSERPKVIVWKPNATHQANLAEMPINPKGFHYFLVSSRNRLRYFRRRFKSCKRIYDNVQFRSLQLLLNQDLN
jgi:hypothetical protein